MTVFNLKKWEKENIFFLKQNLNLEIKLRPNKTVFAIGKHQL